MVKNRFNPQSRIKNEKSIYGSVKMGGETISFYLQCGLDSERMQVDNVEVSLTRLKELAYDFVQSLNFKKETPIEFGMSSLNLYMYKVSSKVSSESEAKFVPVMSIADLVQDSVIYVVCAGSQTERDVYAPHVLNVYSYRSPTFCDKCGEMLIGLVRQGVKCEVCNGNFHKKCILNMTNSCSSQRRRLNVVGSNVSAKCSSASFESSNSSESGGQKILRNQKMGGKHSLMPALSICGRSTIPHNFSYHTYKVPTKCVQCNKFLIGVYKQGLQCKDCKCNVHKCCAELVITDCVPSDMDLLTSSLNDSVVSTDTTSASVESVQDLSPITPPADTLRDEDVSQYIPVQRLCQSVVQKKKADYTVIEGWLEHCTDLSNTRKRHYWKVGTKNLTMYNNEVDSRFYKDIPLSNILSVTIEDGADFTLKTCTLIVYVYVIHKNKKNATSADWIKAIQSVMKAPTSRDTDKNQSDVQEAELCDTHEQLDADISSVYQIYSDDLLGSGHFGMVYRGEHRLSGEAVAIKIIDKRRFPVQHANQLKNEVDILQDITHPGVVALRAMFESINEIFVVMEKMENDMLEMVLSVQKLCERKTRFLTIQIVTALCYLHSRNIVHCDLKPENVLLVTNDDLPQVKLCDFGYSRIINERSFRKSIVGTPAYIGPEVLMNKGYNKSVDMWSVGIIIYVSLSGTFPFNEDEDVTDQIYNAAFMFPADPWKEISSDAIDLIMSLLRIKPQKRFTADKTLLHSWLQNYQSWCDLRALESRIGVRYLTHESDDAYWLSNQYNQSNR